MIGCGAVGLNALQGARLAGAATIIAADVGAAKLERAQGVRRDPRASTPSAADVVEQVKRPHRAAAAPTMCSRQPGILRRFASRWKRCARPGRWSGSARSTSTRTSRFRWGSLMGEKRIVRSSYGDALPKRDFPWLCSALARRQARARRPDHPAHRPRRDQRRLRRPGARRRHPHRGRIRLSGPAMKHPPLAADHVDAPHREFALGDLKLESGETIARLPPVVRHPRHAGRRSRRTPS